MSVAALGQKDTLFAVANFSNTGANIAADASLYAAKAGGRNRVGSS